MNVVLHEIGDRVSAEIIMKNYMIQSVGINRKEELKLREEIVKS